MLGVSLTYIVVGCILLVLILVVVAIMIQYRYEQQIKQLNQRFEQVSARPLGKIIDHLEKAGLSGDSAETFNRWRREYARLIKVAFGDIYQRLLEVGKVNRHFKLWQVRPQLQEVNDQISSVDRDLDDIEQGLNLLNESTHHSSSWYAQLNQTYTTMFQNLSTQILDFGPTAQPLIKKLQAIEPDLQAGELRAQQGDVLGAKETYQHLQEQLVTLQQLMDRIPDRYHELDGEFPSQLSELKGVYKQLTDEGYAFGDPAITEYLATLQNRLANGITGLEKLNLNSVEAENKETAQKIDDLYQRFEDEIAAKQVVTTKQEDYQHSLNQVSMANAALANDLDHLNQSYVLTHGEVDNVKDMDAQLELLGQHYQDDFSAILAHQAVYSEVEQHFKEGAAQLDRIAKAQQEIYDNVAGLYDAEKVAQSSVLKFETELLTLRRHVERLRLPGLPADYLAQYRQVQSEIKTLKEDLNQVKIDMEDITHRLIVTQTDLNTLTQRTTVVKEAAQLTEQTIQYAQRFTHNHAEIAEAIQTGTVLYNHDFDYSKALDAVATALEQVEPGAFKRIEDAYYEQEKRAL